MQSTGDHENTSRKHTYIILTPVKRNFYIIKLGFTGVDIIFLISAQKHRLWVLVRTASFYVFFRMLSENFQFSVVKFLIYLNRCVFVMIGEYRTIAVPIILNHIRIRAVWSESSLGAFGIPKDTKFFLWGQRRLWIVCAKVCFLMLQLIWRRHFHCVTHLYHK